MAFLRPALMHARRTATHLAPPHGAAALVALLMLALLAGCNALAQPTKDRGRGQPDASDTAPLEESEEVAHDSPRAALADFIKVCRAGDYEAAALYLDLPPDSQQR